MNNTLNICLACDDNYAPYMGMAIFSVLKNAAPQDKFHFYILDNKISAISKKKIESLRATHPFELTYLPFLGAI